jgi:ribosomal protein S27AE
MESENTEVKKRKNNTPEYNANYYATNKDATLAKLMANVICPNCGGNSCAQHLKRHMKSKLCQKRSAK